MPTVWGLAGLEGVCEYAGGHACVSVCWVGSQESATELMSFPGNTHILFLPKWKERLIAGHSWWVKVEDEKPLAAPGQTPPQVRTPEPWRRRPTEQHRLPLGPAIRTLQTEGRGPETCPPHMRSGSPPSPSLFSLPPSPPLIPTLLLPAPLPFPPLCLLSRPSYFLLRFLPLFPLLCVSSAHQVLSSCQSVSQTPSLSWIFQILLAPVSFAQLPAPLIHQCLSYHVPLTLEEEPPGYIVPEPQVMNLTLEMPESPSRTTAALEE